MEASSFCASKYAVSVGNSYDNTSAAALEKVELTSYVSRGEAYLALQNGPYS